MTSPQESTENTEKTESAEKEEETLGTKSTLESVGPCKVKIAAEIPPEKVTEELDRNYKELISSVQIPGFRRGRVPRQLIEKRYGTEIEGDVKEVLLGISFQEVVKEKDLKVIGQPKFGEVALTKGEPLRYEVEVEVRPEFELGPYEGIEVEEIGEDAVPAVTDAMVDEHLDALRTKRQDLVVIDPRDAGPQDLLSGHYTLTIEGMKVHEVEEIRFKPESGIINAIPVVDLAGKVAGRGESPSFKVAVKVPDKYSAEVLRGKDAELEFTIEEAHRLQLPAADDEFAKGIGAASLADLRDRIRKELEEHRKARIAELQEEKILQKVTGSVQFDLPEGLLAEQVKMQKLRLQIGLIQEGLPKEEVETRMAQVEEKATEDLRREVKEYFVLDKIAEAEKIYATEDEVEARVAILARAYGRSFSDIATELEENGRIEMLRTEIRHSKVKKFLLEKARIGGRGAAEAPPAPAAPEAAPAGTPGEGPEAGGNP